MKDVCLVALSVAGLVCAAAYRPVTGDMLSSGTGWIQVTNIVAHWSGTTGGAAPGAGATVYLSPVNTFNSMPNTDSAGITRVPATRAVMLQNLYVVLSAAPGTSKTNTITVMINGQASALSIDVIGAATNGNDATHTVSVPAGAEIGIRITTAAGSPASRVAWAFEGRQQ